MTSNFTDEELTTIAEQLFNSFSEQEEQIFTLSESDKLKKVEMVIRQLAKLERGEL